MKKMIKGILIGFASAILLLSTTTVFAQSISTELKNIIFKIDGKQVTNITNGITYNNELYLPAEKLIKSLNYSFAYNSRTNLADLTKINPSEQKSQYKLEKIRFYESGYNCPSDKFRIYSSTFSKSTSRYINWEVELSSNVSSKDRNLEIRYIYYRPDGIIDGIFDGKESSEDDSFIFANNLKSATFSWGFGSQTHGHWVAGTYKVELYVDRTKIATSSFKIIDDSKANDEKIRLIASTQNINYTDLLRDTNKFKNKTVEFFGKVLEVNEVSDSVQMYVDVSDREDEYKILSLSYTGKEGESKILKGDSIEFWGLVDGIDKHDVFGELIDVPEISVKYFNFISEDNE